MFAIFQKVDKIRLAYDTMYKIVLFLCKLPLVVGILITTTTVAGGHIPSTPDPAWNEEVVLTCMPYMAVSSAALAIRRGAHIHMTAFNRYLLPKLARSLDTVANLAVLALTVIMITMGRKYATGVGAKGTYVSMSKVPRLWMYFPVPLAGVAILAFETEALYNYAKSFFIKEEME